MESSRPVRGYPSLSQEMGRNPEFAIIRRFGALNVQRILYLQAKLMVLEQQLRRQETVDATVTARESVSSSYEREVAGVDTAIGVSTMSSHEQEQADAETKTGISVRTLKADDTRDWLSFSGSENNNSERLRLWEEIDKTLKEYSM